MFLRLSLIALVLAAACGPRAWAESQPRLPVLTNEEAWGRLPEAPEEPERLPIWARAYAGPMPVTTARMLELDALHRTGDRLDGRLRALTRWAAAGANNCAYGKEAAAADFRRCGGDPADLEAVANDPGRLPALERAAVAFARKMMRQAHAVTDGEVRALVELAGEQRVVALVALLAHASFQDRVVLALGVNAEPDGPVPPVTVKFGRPEAKPPAAPQGPAPVPEVKVGPDASAGWQGLQEELEKQRARSGRIRIPSREEVARRIGGKHPAAWQGGILWSRVCYGYQPELTDAWFDCANAFRQESGLDRLFQNEIFWVVTDSVRCFY